MTNRPLLVVLLTLFIDLVGFGIIIPLQPFYVEAAGGSGAAVGALFAAYSLAQFVTVPLWGRLSDRIGRRPIILVTLVGTGLSFLAFAAGRDHLVVLFAARIAAGVFAANLATAQAYVADTTSGRDRARGMGLLGAAFGLGFIVGPALGGLLALLGPAWPPAAAGALALLNAGFAWFALPETRERKERPEPWRWLDPRGLRAARANPVLAALFAILFLAIFSFSNLETTFALLMERNLGFDRSQASFVFVLVGVVSVAVQGGLFGWLARRFGGGPLILAGTLLLSAGLFLLPWVASLPGLVALTVVVSTGASLNRPAVSTLVSLTASPDEQGALMGAATSLTSLARVLGPLTAGALWDAHAVSPYHVAAAVMLLAFAVAWSVRRRLPAP